MIMTCDFFSFALSTNVTMKVFVPTKEGEEQITDKEAIVKDAFPVVYLLHGAYGNYHSWTRFSSVERYAQEHQCVLVMPSAENSFYHNLRDGRNYYDFFVDELRYNVNKIFPVSTKREDTYVAGFSMGGYGAWYLALRRPDLFAKAASMSGALDLAFLHGMERYRNADKPINWRNIVDDPDHIAGTSADLIALYDGLVSNGTQNIPALYQSCGTEDVLYELNLSMRDRLQKRGCDLTYHSDKGDHSWDFWDRDIQNVLQWLLPISK